MSAIDRIAIRRVDVECATVISAQPFTAVLSKLAAAIGHPDMSEFARAVTAARTSADLDAVVNAAIGTVAISRPNEQNYCISGPQFVQADVERRSWLRPKLLHGGDVVARLAEISNELASNPLQAPRDGTHEDSDASAHRRNCWSYLTEVRLGIA